MRAYNQALNACAVQCAEWRDPQHTDDRSPITDRQSPPLEPPSPEMPVILNDEDRPPLPEETSSRAGRLRHFANFVSGHLALLAQFPKEALPLANNYTGPVAETADRLLSESMLPVLCRSPRPPAFPFRPQCLRTLEGHSAPVCSVSVSPDGGRAVSGSHDNTLRVWDLESGRQLAIYRAESGVLSVTFASDRDRIVVATMGGQIHFLTPVNFPSSGPPIVTPGQQIPCPLESWGKPLQLNPFVVDGRGG